MTTATTTTDATPTDLMRAACEALGLTVQSQFVALSQSRNAGEPHPTLNWTVTILRNGREVLRTDYSAGAAHCPSYGKQPRASYQGTAAQFQRDAIAFECQHGRKAVTSVLSRGGFATTGAPIEPDAVAVIWSLTQDASVLDAGGFENWASDYGYDTDSIKAEKTYQACLDLALRLRAAIGDAGIETLRTAGQDY